MEDATQAVVDSLRSSHLAHHGKLEPVRKCFNNCGVRRNFVRLIQGHGIPAEVLLDLSSIDLLQTR